MNLNSIEKDIKLLEQALKLIEKTDNNLYFKKSHLILEVCEQIHVLKDKSERQKNIANTLIY